MTSVQQTNPAEEHSRRPLTWAIAVGKRLGVETF